MIEASGSTSLTEVGNNFYLNTSSGSGPALKYGGADVVAGQFGAWAPIGAEQTASGYEVAWKITGTDQYTVWNTDSSGNYLSDTGYLLANSPTLETLETSFNQDLNGDGTIGIPTLATSGNATQSIVTIGGASNEGFIFHPIAGAETIVNAASSDKTELDGFQPVGAINLTALLTAAQDIGYLHALHLTNGSADTLGNHDGINVQISDLHASNFIIH